MYQTLSKNGKWDVEIDVEIGVEIDFKGFSLPDRIDLESFVCEKGVLL